MGVQFIFRRLALICAIVGPLFCSVNITVADEVRGQLRILTSMSERVYEPFVEGFKAQYPLVDVLVLNKNTNHALGEVSLGNKRGFDVFWASSPEAFDMLADFDLLEPTNGEDYQAFALSALGWSWRKGELETPPSEWNMLLDPSYQGRIGIARPSRSGTTHLLIEQILQDRGWDDGWRFILELSANFATITSRSFGVIDGLKSRRFDVGLNIDFLALSEDGLSFSYGRPVMLVPARIAKLANGGNPDLASLFIDYVLSPEGQRLLLLPELNRVPILKEVRDEVNYDQFPELKSALKLSWASFDPEMAARRYWMVNEIFDQFITNQFERRRNLWRIIREQEAKPELASALRKRVQRAKQYLLTMPIAEHELMQMEPSPMPGPGSRYAPMTAEQKSFQVRWNAQANMLLNLAENELRAIAK